jgi:predicted Zn-dependent protease
LIRTAVLRDLVILLSVFGAVWLIFSYAPIFPKMEVELTVEQEEEIGELIVTTVISKEFGMEVLEDAGVDSMLNKIHRRLVEQLGSTPYTYQIKVILNKQVNAITLPGGPIFVFSGLVDFASSPEELAAVLAHEIGHVEHRHVVSKMVKEFSLELLLGGLSGKDAGVVGEVIKTAASTVFDRRQEREADAFALELLSKAGIHPNKLASFFQRLEQEEGSYPEQLELLMTHPHHHSRIQAAREHKLPTTFKERAIEMDWPGFRKRVAGE